MPDIHDKPTATRPSEDDMISKPRARAMARQLNDLDGECVRLAERLRELEQEAAATKRERDVLRSYVEVLASGGFFGAKDWVRGRGGDWLGDLDRECLRLADEAKEGQ